MDKHERDIQKVLMLLTKINEMIKEESSKRNGIWGDAQKAGGQYVKQEGG